MGSYFQSPNQTNKSLTWLKNCLENKPQLVEECSLVLQMLQKAIDVNQGLYITF
jgi:hypothetical protein